MEGTTNMRPTAYATSIDAVTPDSVRWYPMRVTYGRERQVKVFLDGKSIECFLPMRQDIVYSEGKGKIKEEPAISNLLFVHASFDFITQLKHGYREAEPLRYMTYHSVDKPEESIIITVPDRQMDNFILACKGPAENLLFLNPEELAGKVQQRVEVTAGPFKGVKGVVKRVHGNRKIVVELDGLCGVQLKMVSKTQIRILQV